MHVDVQPAFRGGKRERGQPQDNSLNSPEHEVYPDPRQPPIQSLNCDVIKIEDFEIEKKKQICFLSEKREDALSHAPFPFVHLNF